MEAFYQGDIWWLALAVPALVVLLVLCIDCRDAELDTPPIDDYQYKPSTCNSTRTFELLRRPPSPPWPAIQTQPQSWRCPPQILPIQPASVLVNEEDNDSLPSYENQVGACVADDDGAGYIEVLPDPPPTGPENGDCASSGSIAGSYENLESSPRNSLGEYVNVLDPEATIVDPIFVGTSDQESEDDTPDYENVCPGI